MKFWVLDRAIWVLDRAIWALEGRHRDQEVFTELRVRR